MVVAMSVAVLVLHENLSLEVHAVESDDVSTSIYVPDYVSHFCCSELTTGPIHDVGVRPEPVHLFVCHLFLPWNGDA